MATIRAVVVSGAVVLAAVWAGGCSSSSHTPAPKADPSASATASPGASGSSGAAPTADDRAQGGAQGGAKGGADDRPSGPGAASDRPGDHCAIVCSAAGDRTPGAATGLPEYPGPSASGEPAGR
jgi:hypothetical protein